MKNMRRAQAFAGPRGYRAINIVWPRPNNKEDDAARAEFLAHWDAVYKRREKIKNAIWLRKLNAARFLEVDPR
jgi:hypothetical protein